MRDVAALAGVSVGTVSNVLNDSRPVAPATAQKVHEAIEQLGFVRNDAARQLRVGQSRTIGMMVLDIANPFFTDLARGVEDALALTTRSLIFGNSGEDPVRELGYLDLFEEQRVAGLLISPVGDVLPRLERLRQRGSAVVLVDRDTEAEAFSSVAVDDRRGGELAASHLLGLGRTAIAFVGGSTAITQVRLRIEGAEAAIAAHGGGAGSSSSGGLRHIPSPSMNSAAGRNGAEQLLRLPAAQRPDAVFAANDLVALGVLQAFTAAGIRVPDDIALIGYDDIDFAASAAIPLSSVRQPSREMGRTATDLLVAEIEAPGEVPRQHVVFQPTLAIRDSTAGAAPAS
ncbi:LacI family transcriptional regulator [Subtercola sp. Z020]|nr:LacI family transcriptional regulator [Subtercola sp. Z020]